MILIDAIDENYQEESTSLGKGRGEANDVDLDTNALDVDHETNKESKVGLPRTEGAPESESVRMKEANMERSGSTNSKGIGD